MFCKLVSQQAVTVKLYIKRQNFQIESICSWHDKCYCKIKTRSQKGKKIVGKGENAGYLPTILTFPKQYLLIKSF